MVNNNVHTEDELYRLIAAGDEQAFAVLFKDHYPAMFSNALRYLASEFWAEEIVQEAFVAAWVHRAELPGIINVGAWLHRIVWNKSMDRIAHQQVEVKAQYALSRLQQASQNPLDSETLENRERAFAVLEEAVARLPAQRQTIYRMRYHHKKSLETIASELGLSRNTVRNHLALATDNIRHYLAKYGNLFILFFFHWYILLPFPS